MQRNSAFEVYWRLQNWVGFRQAYSDTVCNDHGVDAWAEHTDFTCRLATALEHIDYTRPRDLFHTAIAYMAEARRWTVKKMFRDVMRDDRSLSSGACRCDEVSELSLWLAQLYLEVTA